MVPRTRTAVASSALTSLVAALTLMADAPPRIVIDGRFDDWASVPPVVRDPSEPAAGMDFRDVHVTADGRYLYLLLDFRDPVNLHGLAGSAALLLDADANAGTGRREAGLSGVDVV